MAYMLYYYPWIIISDIFMPYWGTYTETVVAVTVTIVVVEVEWTCISIVIVTPTFEKRIIVAAVDTNKVRVRSGKSPLFAQAMLDRKVT